jgi:hypothetical protein
VTFIPMLRGDIQELVAKTAWNTNFGRQRCELG